MREATLLWGEVMSQDNPLDQLASAVARHVPYQQIPQYPDIVKGAKLLHRQATLARIMAVVAGFLWPVIFVAVLNAGLRGISIHYPSLPAFLFILSAGEFPTMFLAFGLWNSAIRLDLQAGLALAQRDIAMNSFKIGR
jgi:hypothetical protein